MTQSKPISNPCLSPEIEESAGNCIAAFMKFCEDYDPIPLAVEQECIGAKYGGRIDFIGTIMYKGVRQVFVGDWKTSSSWAGYEEYRTQLAAYKNTPEAQQHKPFGCFVCRLDKTTAKYNVKFTMRTEDKDWRVFQKMRDLFYERHDKLATQAGIPF